VLDAGEGRQGEVDGERRLDAVAVVVAGLADRVLGVVEDVDIEAGTAVQRVGAGAADERVVAVAAGQTVGAAAAGDAVGGVVAGEDNRLAGRERVVLDPGDQPDGDGRPDLVVQVAAELDHLVAGGVDVVDVVAGAAGHRVGAGLAVEDVGEHVPGDNIVGGVADGRDGAPEEQDVLDVGRERVAEGLAVDGLDAGAGRFGDQVLGVVDLVEVVAVAADEAVGAGAAVERVVAVVAGEDIGGAVANDVVGAGIAGAPDGAAAGQQQGLDVALEREGDRGLDR